MPRGIYLHKSQSKEWVEKRISKLRGKNRSFSNTWKNNLSKSLKGRVLTKEWKKKIGIANSKRVWREESKNKLRQWHINNPNIKFKDTSIELKVEAELQKKQIKYKKQKSLNNVGIVDFYLPKYKIVIECDGCYWHNCPTHGKGEVKNCSKKDRRKDSVLITNGYKIYRFWEHEINKSPERCINTLGL